MGRMTKLQINPRIIKGKSFWQITVPKPGGGRQQKTFKDKGEAKTFLDLKRIELRNRGTSGISMSDQIRGDALSALEILTPFEATLLDAARFYSAHHAKLARSETVAKAVELFLSHKKPDCRPGYYKDLHYRLERFKLTFGSRKLADLTPGEIQDWSNAIPNLETGGSLSPRSRNTYMLRVSALLTYSKNRGWISENVTGGLKKAKTRSDEEVGTLTTEQAGKLLSAADRRTLPYFAIGLFAGLRSVELEKLDWSSIHWDTREIQVKSKTSKTGSKRFVPIRENLVAWLEAYHNETGLIYPGRKRLEAARERAGLLKDWPNNALRHSFASYSLAHFRDSARLSLDMGQMNPKIIFQNYHQLVRASDAAKYWALLPTK
jgi:integrase